MGRTKKNIKLKHKKKPVEHKERVKFNMAIHGELLRWMARAGQTDEDMAQEIGISRTTLHRWKVQYPDLRLIMQDAKNIADAKVEQALYDKAVGRREIVETETTTVMIDGEECPRVTVRKKPVLGDTTAQIFWLKNRQPAKWRDRKELGVDNNDNLWAEALAGIADEMTDEDRAILDAIGEKTGGEA